jgi:hypothetical protein
MIYSFFEKKKGGTVELSHRSVAQDLPFPLKA